MLSNPIRRQVHPAAIAALLDLLGNHFFSIDFKFDFLKDTAVCMLIYAFC